VGDAPPFIRLERHAKEEGPMDFETRPAFASSWITPERILEGDVAARYLVEDVPVTILSPRGASCGTYLVDPPEYRMNPRHLKVLTEVMEALRSN
jgi:hypothetical protein